MVRGTTRWNERRGLAPRQRNQLEDPAVVVGSGASEEPVDPVLRQCRPAVERAERGTDDAPTVSFLGAGAAGRSDASMDIGSLRSAASSLPGLTKFVVGMALFSSCLHCRAEPASPPWWGCC